MPLFYDTVSNLVSRELEAESIVVFDEAHNIGTFNVFIFGEYFLRNCKCTRHPVGLNTCFSYFCQTDA